MNETEAGTAGEKECPSLPRLVFHAMTESPLRIEFF